MWMVVLATALMVFFCLSCLICPLWEVYLCLIYTAFLLFLPLLVVRLYRFWWFCFETRASFFVSCCLHARIKSQYCPLYRSFGLDGFEVCCSVLYALLLAGTKLISWEIALLSWPMDKWGALELLCSWRTGENGEERELWPWPFYSSSKCEDFSVTWCGIGFKEGWINCSSFSLHFVVSLYWFSCWPHSPTLPQQAPLAL